MTGMCMPRTMVMEVAMARMRMVTIAVVVIMIVGMNVPKPPERIEIMGPRRIIRTSPAIDRAARVIRVPLTKPAAAA